MRRLFAVCFVCACTGSPNDRPATWSYLHAAIIAPSCATSSCHSQRAATAGVVLDDPDTAYQTLIDRQYVIPGDDGSTLLLLLDGDERRRMPPDAPLPAADIDLVRTWIEQGAQK
ncbi:MAG TPA: c-type cytochrome domain-containing protein [Kofleriaceae bacterium]|nr:c-type cytochrome domain-containing protein [Kofleriaceae bacterium]